MSHLKRYTESMPDISYGMDESKKGEYVLYKDYAKLKAENERLRMDLDYVLDDWGCFKVGHSGGSGIDSVFKAWLYAKGGQP
jgi:hypothetical protein